MASRFFGLKALHLCLLATWVGSTLTWGQGGCDHVPEGKVLKLLEKAQHAEKFSAEERVQFWEQAWDGDPECLACMQGLGDLRFRLAQQGKGSWVDAREPLAQLVLVCPNFHAEPHYQLGAIAYASGDYANAQAHFEAFLSFPDEVEERLGKRYNRQVQEVREVMPQIAFELSFRQFEGVFTPHPVRGINSADDEYLPALSPDGTLLFLTRKFNYKAKGDVVSQQIERFSFAERAGAEGPFGPLEPLPEPFNTGPHYGGASISVDNRELYIAAENPLPGAPQNIDLFRVPYEVVSDGAQGIRYQWGKLEALPFPINTPDWEAQPALSADGKELFFAAIHAGTTPDASQNPTMDIMVCQRGSDGSWGAPQPLPSPINSGAHDKSPFLHPDGKTLFFSSDRKPSGGGYDLYVAVREPDGSWSEPRNLGAPVNTPGDEHGLVVSTDGREAFFASRRPGTQGLDILSFPLPDAFRPEEMTILKGTLRKPDGTAPEAGATLRLEFLQSGTATELRYQADDGRFAQAIRLPAGEDVVLVAEGEGMGFDALIVQQKDEPRSSPPPPLALESRKLTSGQPLEIRNIEFATNSAQLDAASQVLLTTFANYLIHHPAYRAQIWGHTDNSGLASENQALSERRAEAVRHWLIESGVPPDRLKARGWGASKPLESNESESGRARNRRTECVIENF